MIISNTLSEILNKMWPIKIICKNYSNSELLQIFTALFPSMETAITFFFHHVSVNSPSPLLFSNSNSLVMYGKD